MIESEMSVALSEGEIVLIFAARALSNPQHNGGEHHANALRDVGISIVYELLGVVVEHIFQDQHGLGKGSVVFQHKEDRVHTTLPASPPAIRANPMNRNSRALHTALESPNPSSPRILSLSIMLMTR